MTAEGDIGLGLLQGLAVWPGYQLLNLQQVRQGTLVKKADRVGQPSEEEGK